MKKWVSAIALLMLIASCLVGMFVPISVSASSIVFYSTGVDGTTSNFGENTTYSTVLWPAPHDTTTDDNMSVEYSTTTLKLGQDNNTGTSWIWRPVLVFDTSSLDPRTTISAATISIWGTVDETDVNDNITVVEAGDVHNPLVADDFDVLWYQTENLSTGFDTSGFVVGAYNTITLNTTGISKIQTNGNTVFGLRTQRDIVGNDPDGDEWVKFASGESSHPPKLTLTYTVSSLAAPDLLDVSDVMVFSDVLEDGDELFVFRTTVDYASGVSTEVPQEWFAVQIKDISVRAQVPLARWGYSPMGIYLSDNDSVLPWGEAYDIEITGTALFTTIPSSSYTLQSGDWKGSNTELLESWAYQTALWLVDKDNIEEETDYIIADGSQWKLTEAAATIFLNGVPFLDAIIPDVFLSPTVIYDKDDPLAGTFSPSLYDNLGPWITTALDSIGGAAISGQWILTVIAGLGALGAMWAVRRATNDSRLSLCSAILVFGIGFYFGIPLGAVVVVEIVLILLLGYNIFLRLGATQ